MYPEIDEDLCIICGICADYCTSKILRETPSGINVVNPDGCFECELCIELCDMNAIKLVG